MSKKNVIFIDSRVADYQTIVAELPVGTDWYLLNPTINGVSQIQGILANYSGLDSIQIFSYGSSGSIQTGSGELSIQNITDYQSQLAAIGSSLTETGDILLYGCNVAQGEAGQKFVQTLANYTGADVAASTDLTGSAALGGDWSLETNIASIEAKILSMGNSNLLLATSYSLDLNGAQNLSTIDEHWTVGPNSYWWDNVNGQPTGSAFEPSPTIWAAEITTPSSAGIQKLRIQSLLDASLSSSVQWTIGYWSANPLTLRLNTPSTAQAVPSYLDYTAQVVSRNVGNQTFYDLIITKSGTLGTPADFQNILRSIVFKDTSTVAREQTDQYLVQISPDGNTWYGAGAGQADHANFYVDALPPPSLTIAVFHDSIIILNFNDQLAPDTQWQAALPPDLNRFTVTVPPVLCTMTPMVMVALELCRLL